MAVKRSPLHGKGDDFSPFIFDTPFHFSNDFSGLFALEDIAKGTRVAYFKGDLKDSKVSGGNEFH